ncbi:MAG: hypothetical protein KME26_29520 [Oscillatoria princeps RMCB-10]|nr:hypothetical protein [Oscillatoria princeps RMCB-10]
MPVRGRESPGTPTPSPLFGCRLQATLGIRVSQQEEFAGLDIGEHGMEAYSGFALLPVQAVLFPSAPVGWGRAVGECLNVLRRSLRRGEEKKCSPDICRCAAWVPPTYWCSTGKGINKPARVPAAWGQGEWGPAHRTYLSHSEGD